LGSSKGSVQNKRKYEVQRGKYTHDGLKLRAKREGVWGLVQSRKKILFGRKSAEKKLCSKSPAIKKGV